MRSGSLLEGGKLKDSWAPGRSIRELRDLTRQRVHVLEDLNRAKNRIEQLCQAGNSKVSSVATDLFGVSGRKMLQAIIEGAYPPKQSYAQRPIECSAVGADRHPSASVAVAGGKDDFGGHEIPLP
jgi:hypothetical protein